MSRVLAAWLDAVMAIATFSAGFRVWVPVKESGFERIQGLGCVIPWRCQGPASAVLVLSACEEYVRAGESESLRQYVRVCESEST